MATSRNRPTNEQEPDLLSNKGESLDQELQEHQQRLIELRRQQEEVERRKKQLEELDQRRKEISDGQRLLRERFTRALTLLERAEHEVRREAEEIQMTRQTFAENLEQVEMINPATWVEEELNRSISKIDHARAIYNQSRARIDALSGRDISGEPVEDGEEESAPGDPLGNPGFFELVRRGFAFTLPLLILLVILIALLIPR
jgi:DNA repair ATPase RecN